jgi:xanthine/CO dehydrogenase XdhC/CoxF family maturation factor
VSNSHEEIVETMARLVRIEEPFAPTTVVCPVAASVAKPGAQALIRSHGSVIGSLGGGCPPSRGRGAARCA